MAAKEHSVGIRHPTVVPTNFDPDADDETEHDSEERSDDPDPTVPTHR